MVRLADVRELAAQEAVKHVHPVHRNAPVSLANHDEGTMRPFSCRLESYPAPAPWRRRSSINCAPRTRPNSAGREREWTWWADTGGGNALASKPPPRCDPVLGARRAYLACTEGDNVLSRIISCTSTSVSLRNSPGRSRFMSSTVTGWEGGETRLIPPGIFTAVPAQPLSHWRLMVCKLLWHHLAASGWSEGKGVSSSRVSPPGPLSISYGHVGCLTARAFPPPV
jgi:hypothetical protein